MFLLSFLWLSTVSASSSFQPLVSYGGFIPIQGARGPSYSPPQSGPSPPLPPPPLPYAPAVSLTNGYDGGAASVPVKTIYVNVPSAGPAPVPKPIAAGPPRKHYKIVFIRAPAPPPPPQPILPPRTERRTIIYVLHQKPRNQPQRVIEVPSISHDPQVYFVQYENPPTPEDLQQLYRGDIGVLSAPSRVVDAIASTAVPSSAVPTESIRGSPPFAPSPTNAAAFSAPSASVQDVGAPAPIDVLPPAPSSFSFTRPDDDDDDNDEFFLSGPISPGPSSSSQIPGAVQTVGTTGFSRQPSVGSSVVGASTRIASNRRFFNPTFSHSVFLGGSQPSFRPSVRPQLPILNSNNLEE